MTNTDIPPTSPSPPHDPPALTAHIALESALLTAFPSLDAPQDALAQLADVPPDPALLAVAPRPLLVSLEELLRAIANAPRIIIRKVGIPLATLFAVLVAFVLHLGIVAIFILVIFFGTHAKSPAGRSVTQGAEGGSGDGYMITGEAPLGDPTLAGTVDNLLAHAPEAAPNPIAPAFPVDPTISGIAPDKFTTESADPDIVGIASGPSLMGTPKPRPRPAIAPTPGTLVVAPPNTNFFPSTPNNTVASAAGRTGPIAASPRGGAGQGGSDEGPPLDIRTKPGKGGLGSGRGNKAGEGVDRGLSGANSPEPLVLEWGNMPISDSVLHNPPDRNIIIEVTILADGKPDKDSIKIVQSCGKKDLDELWKSAVLHTKFRPAYAAGKPFATTTPMVYVFNSSEEE